MPSKLTDGIARGYIIPIGGAEKKFNQPVILKKFVSLSGGKKAKIVILPTASKLSDTGPRYVEIFESLNVKEAVSLPINLRSDCSKESYLEHLESATGIFITGGNQLRLSTIMGGTPLARLVRKLNARGTHVAGTSAGAAIIPEHMISGGIGGSTPKEDGVTLSPGLGLTNALIIDQHFRQRDRLGRLLTALSYNPFATGIGLDEDTAVFIRPDNTFEVVGSGGVTVVDPSNISYSSMGSARKGEAISLFGLNLHILGQGNSFNMNTREAIVSEKLIHHS
ncbi:MAG: cyanophycinase [Calditrichaeota bacterium]|nr:cyanophycinase [Calditrichota bacterium]